jgi:hypothetical protein
MKIDELLSRIRESWFYTRIEKYEIETGIGQNYLTVLTNQKYQFYLFNN